MWVPMPEGRGVLYGRRMRTSHVLPFALLSLLLAGCPTEGGEAPVDTTVTYIEGEDGDNDEFDDPEEVDVVWTDRLLIEGSARECDWDNAEDWPWQGDLDNYLIFNPDRGYLEARLTWETDRIDLDLLEIVIELESASDVGSVLDAVHGIVRQELHFNSTTLCRYPAGESYCLRLGIRSTHGRLAKLEPGVRFEIDGDPLLVELAGGVNVQVIEDARTDPRTSHPGIQALDLRTSVRVASTLNDGSRVVLEFASIGDEGVRRLSAAELEFARGVVAHAGAAIERILIAEARDRSATVVEALHLATSSTAGQEFFEAFVAGLSATLGVRHALVCRDDRSRPGWFEAMACIMDGQLVPPFSYRAEGTPCADVRSKGDWIVRAGVQAAYPDDIDLVRMEADSFYGARMADRDGATIGHCAVLHDEPFSDEELVRRTVGLFASRASLELQRQTVTEGLERSLESQRVLNELMGITLEDLSFDKQLEAALAVVLDSEFFEGEVYGTICCFESGGNLERAASLTVGGDAGRTEELWSTGMAGLFDSDNGGMVEASLFDGSPILGVPIRSGEVDFGVLKLLGRRDLPREELRSFCVAVAQGIAGIISRDRARRELEASEERLRQSQKLEALGSLAGGIAHDFNNLLTAMLGNADLLGETLDPDSPERALLDGVLRAGLSAGQLTRQLLAFTRRQMLERSSLDLAALVGEATRMLERVVPEDIPFRVELPAEPCDVLADRGQLEQVLMNLVVNARDAMPTGGEVRVRVGAATNHPGHVCLSVEDTGQGMDADTRTRIFEPFFTTKGAGEGTGLGLSVVYGIVSQHEGWIEVDSRSGGGTRFDIFLPRHVPREGEASAANGEGEVLHMATDRARVLMVEDDPAVRQVSRAMLEHLGYDVVEAADGREALERFDADGDFAILILDVVMPGLSGVDVFQRVRAACPDQPVLFVTGHDATERLRDLESDDRVELLRKPYTRLELGTKLSGLLQGAQA